MSEPKPRTDWLVEVFTNYAEELHKRRGQPKYLYIALQRDKDND